MAKEGHKRGGLRLGKAGPKPFNYTVFLENVAAKLLEYQGELGSYDTSHDDQRPLCASLVID